MKHEPHSSSQESGTDSRPFLPHIILLEPTRTPKGLIENWEESIKKYFSDIPEGDTYFSIVEGFLEEADPEKLECDCIVSPANSWGIMDGGYDDALSKAFKGPNDDYWTLTNQVQIIIRERWHGYLPPGCCIINHLPDTVFGPFDPSTKKGNKFGATSIACLPTMRVPDNVRWHEDLIYNCMWFLLVAIENWNKEHDENKINRVMMTGLATGYGEMPANKCAEQMILAARHFLEPVFEPGSPRWKDVIARTNEIVDTINLDKDRTPGRW